MMKQRRIKNRRALSDRDEILKIQALIWETVVEHYIENEGGVYIDNFGYLCHIIRPKKKFIIFRAKNEVARMKTDGYKYDHMVFDFMPVNKYFHVCVLPFLQKKCKMIMNKGRRYKFLYKEVCNKRHLFKGRNLPRVYKKEELRCQQKNF